MNAKTIKSREAYEEALKQLSVLMDKEFVQNSTNEKDIELPCLAIKNYEQGTAENE